MLLEEAKEILKKNGYRLVEDTKTAVDEIDNAKEFSEYLEDYIYETDCDPACCRDITPFITKWYNKLEKLYLNSEIVNIFFDYVDNGDFAVKQYIKTHKW